MPVSLYQVFVPPCISALENLAGILAKGAAHAEARKIDPAVLVGARLFPDMFPLSRQVQIAGDVAKAAVSRLAGVTAPVYADTEASLPELIERLQKTVAYLRGFEAALVDGKEDATVSWKIHDREFAMKGLPYVTGWVLPNVYFHVATAYNILRHNGVELGKGDYLGRT